MASHPKFHFEKVGHLKQTCFKFGRWLDVIYLELLLLTVGRVTSCAPGCGVAVGHVTPCAPDCGVAVGRATPCAPGGGVERCAEDWCAPPYAWLYSM